MNHNMHHLSARKRLYRNLEPFPHPVRWKREFDELMYAVSIIGPVLVIPQIFQVWVLKNTAGVSLLSWALLGMGSLLWTAYGIIHRERELVVANILFAIANFLVVAGVIVNR